MNLIRSRNGIAPLSVFCLNSTAVRTVSEHDETQERSCLACDDPIESACTRVCAACSHDVSAA